MAKVSKIDPKNTNPTGSIHGEQLEANLLVPWNQFMVLELQNPGSSKSIKGLVEYESKHFWLRKQFFISINDKI